MIAVVVVVVVVVVVDDGVRFVVVKYGDGKHNEDTCGVEATCQIECVRILSEGVVYPT